MDQTDSGRDGQHVGSHRVELGLGRLDEVEKLATQWIQETPDEGRKAVSGRDRDLGKFRVPMLRDVAETGPYYHDGSIETLEEAVTLMVKGGKENENLSMMLKAMAEEEASAEDVKDLVAFLRSLSGEYPK